MGSRGTVGQGITKSKRTTHNMMVQNALDDVASGICQALPRGNTTKVH